MTTYSASQIAAVARGAGFTGDALTTAVAVALAESSGRVEVVNSIGATGLWQILQPLHVKTYPHWSREWLQNPKNNAQAAFILSSGGTNWRPWQVYTNGMYRLHLNTARAAVGAADTGDAPAPAAPAVTDDNRDVYSRIQRNAVIGFGAILILVALLKLANAPQIDLKKAASTVADVLVLKGKGTAAKAGAAVKVAS